MPTIFPKKFLLIASIPFFILQSCLGKPTQMVRTENQQRIIPPGFHKQYLQQVINLSDQFLLSNIFRSYWKRFYQQHPYFSPVYKKQNSHFFVEYTINNFKAAILPRPSNDFPQRILFWIQVSILLSKTTQSLENKIFFQDVSISHLEISDQDATNILWTVGTDNLLKSLFNAIDNFLLRGTPLPQEHYPEYGE